jgi:hypothetical protein
VICLKAGTYRLSESLYISRSGAPGKPIVLRRYRGAAVLKWTSKDSDPVVGVTRGTQYVEVRGLIIDGRNTATANVNCNTAAHLRVIGNTLLNGGAGGVTTYQCDYVTVDRNLIYHSGYGTGWSSGVSLNNSIWSDRYDGFHSYVTNNIISGSSDESRHHTEGNGIIMDLGGNTPSVLVGNNVVYENGGRCIHSFEVQHIWIVSNTCYKNGLDSRPGRTGEFTSAGTGTSDIHWIDNIAYASGDRFQYARWGQTQVAYRANNGFGGLVGVRQAFLVNPQFVSAPVVNAHADRQQQRALPPWKLGKGLRLRRDSPLVNRGINPLADPSLNADQRREMAKRLLTDRAGVRRPQEGLWDVGAYELRTASR